MKKSDMVVNRARSSMRVKNAMMAGSGAGGVGDRGFGQYIPINTGNPFDSNDYVYRWRQYVHLYETSWEARKVIRIPIEDALRKDWELENIPEPIANKINFALTKLNFRHILGRSMMLERLLGGCLTFMGIDANKDEPEKPYNVAQGDKLRFLNAIPVSRIARLSWSTDPLSEHYMRPELYTINGNEVHVSRFLVWDGEPLFDPYDFALTNFRSNLAGFGPSKLAPIWDDIVKAVGSRQAAYQLIQTNNAIIAAVEDLADLQGTTSGRLALQKVKEIANQLSLYKAAVIDGNKIDVRQHSASFGSVPELILTFIQIISAASDIPATRFLGQAPGGLNATGESDLENYYNMIDSLQRQRIEPALRRVIDIVGYKESSNWKKERENLDIKFPPLWNLTELEEADLHAKEIDNALKLYDAGFVNEKKVVEEINAKGALTVDLDESDIGITGDTGYGGMGNPDDNVDPQVEIDRLRGQKDKLNTFLGNEVKNTYFVNNWPLLISQAGVDPRTIPLNQFIVGFEEEQEHIKSVGGDEVTIAKIVLDHLREDAQYYSKLKKIENAIHLDRLPAPTEKQKHAGNYKKHHLNLHGLNITIENPRGSMRQGKDADGTEWSSILPAHYGYIKRTEGADDDHVDVYIGPDELNEQIYIIDQANITTGEFDEHKVMMGCSTPQQARQLYIDAFTDGKGSARIWDFHPVTIDDFKYWLKTGDTRRPFVNDKRVFKEEDHPRAADGKFGSGGGAKKAEQEDKKAQSIIKRTRTTLTPEQKKEASDKRFAEQQKSRTPEDQKAFQKARDKGIIVPPAWTNVMVSDNPKPATGVVAKGVDASGRKQVIEYPGYRDQKIKEKHTRISKKLMPIWNKKVNELKSNLDNEENKVLYLMSQTAFRIGSLSDTKAQQQAYGASTLRGSHVKVLDDGSVHFSFPGKKGVMQNHIVNDPIIHDMVKDKAGKDEPIFETTDAKIRKQWITMGGDKPHDMRSLIATSIAKQEVEKMDKPADEKARKKAELDVAVIVAKKLGNDPKESHKTYIDNNVFAAWRK